MSEHRTLGFCVDGYLLHESYVSKLLFISFWVSILYFRRCVPEKNIFDDPIQSSKKGDWKEQVSKNDCEDTYSKEPCFVPEVKNTGEK